MQVKFSSYYCIYYKIQKTSKNQSKKSQKFFFLRKQNKENNFWDKHKIFWLKFRFDKYKMVNLVINILG